MDFGTILLWVGVLVFTSVGVQGLFLPLRIVEPLGGTLVTPSFSNEIRANYGGMHAGIALLLAMGALKPEFKVAALWLLMVFSGGLVVGRVVSWALDGAPNRFIRIFMGLELVGAVAAAVVLLR